MSIEGVLVSYNIEDEILVKNSAPSSASGIKFDNDWVLCHGTLFSLLKTPLKILKSQHSPTDKNFNRLYQQLPELRVTENVIENDNVLNNLSVRTGRTIYMWTCPLLLQTFSTIFSSWSFRKLETSDDTDKIFLSSFILLYIGDKNIQINTIENTLSRLYDIISKYVPIRGQELYLDSTPFSCEVFLNSRTFGVICNVIGKDDCLALCDVSSSLGSEGGPVYLKYNDKLFGIVTTSVSWWQGEWVGLTIVARLASVLYGLNFIKSKNIPYEVNFSAKSMLINHILDKIDSVVVLVRCGINWGSGISLGKGFILTCAHVVEDINNITIVFKGSILRAKVIIKSNNDNAYDLALLQIESYEKNLPQPIKICSTPAIKGENIVAVGFPYFNENHVKRIKPTITKGYVNNVTPWTIQSSCCVQSGFSGGALLRIFTNNITPETIKCELLGVIVCNVKNEDNMVSYPFVNMAIPANILRNSIEKFLDNPLKASLSFENDNKEVQSIWKFVYPKNKFIVKKSNL